ncbi:hypothetical protein E1176_19075 [Fulvivirga sp. RKSG066]|uniref:hypothetical protein n=1 Tax=Fulvivirga aurantia TaxID=2529383 RepID=UPI0012BCD808|nr:hypothetical protein [Fulvivirga aurantia]MTI23140.1 hypothetical protein [Fulvivirga aurantia]
MIRLFLLLCFLSCSIVAQATHLRAGSIAYERLNTLTYRITINVYTDTGSEVRLGYGYLDFGDGGDPILLSQIENTDRPDLGDEVATASFTIEHTYPAYGSYLIGYVEPNRNESVLNIDNSVETTFYTETELIIDEHTPFDHSSSALLSLPIFKHNYNDDLSFSLAANDINDYKLRYQLVAPKRD